MSHVNDYLKDLNRMRGRRTEGAVNGGGRGGPPHLLPRRGADAMVLCVAAGRGGIVHLGHGGAAVGSEGGKNLALLLLQLLDVGDSVHISYSRFSSSVLGKTLYTAS
uniref:Uncharacterized protein n=1 Tax=Triticum urartu TaxID=4572 RepID=A0A8R7QL83_TRIUA